MFVLIHLFICLTATRFMRELCRWRHFQWSSHFCRHTFDERKASHHYSFNCTLRTGKWVVCYWILGLKRESLLITSWERYPAGLSISWMRTVNSLFREKHVKLPERSSWKIAMCRGRGSRLGHKLTQTLTLFVCIASSPRGHANNSVPLIFLLTGKKILFSCKNMHTIVYLCQYWRTKQNMTRA